VNDALRAVMALEDPNAILDAASTAIASGVASLYAAGARQFLVWNVPDLGLTPAASILDQQFPGAAALVTFYTQQFNAKLDADLAVVSLLPGIQIRRVNAFETIRAAVNAPEEFGLTNVTVPCIMPGIPPFTCPRPDEYLFWDGLHPTQAGHAILADEARNVLGL
jgi:phospholipase/lecithinase/hemolysin